MPCKGEELLEKAQIELLRNKFFLEYRELTNLLEKVELTLADSQKLFSLYENAENLVKEIESQKKQLSRLVLIIQKKYPFLQTHPTYKFFSTLIEREFLKEVSRQYVEEAKHYLEHDVLEWRHSLQKRILLSQKIDKTLQELEIQENIPLQAPSSTAINIYRLVDKMIIKLFPRVERYRNYGQYLHHNTASSLRKLFGECPNKNAVKQLTEYFSRPKYMAYLDVPAHIVLIDYDVMGGNVESHKQKCLDAAFRTGIDYFFLKVADEYQDSKIISGDELQIFFEYYERAMMGEMKILQHTLPQEVDHFLQFVNYANQKLPLGKNRKSILSKIKKADSKYMDFKEFKKKLLYSKLVARLCADLSLDDFAIYVPHDEALRNFIRNKSLVGNVFDDLKDYQEDKDLGIGYDGKKQVHLFLEMLRTFHITVKKISFKHKVRFLNFCILASLFQLREVVGAKEKT